MLSQKIGHFVPTRRIGHMVLEGGSIEFYLDAEGVLLGRVIGFDQAQHEPVLSAFCAQAADFFSDVWYCSYSPGRFDVSPDFHERVEVSLQPPIQPNRAARRLQAKRGRQ